MLICRARYMLAVLVSCAFSALVFSSVSAKAERGHVLAGSFGRSGAGDGEFSAPAGIAVAESTGTVYVSDVGNNRVEYFSAAGTYEGQFNASGVEPGEGQAAPTGQLSNPEAIAVDNSASQTDPSKGDVYVVDAGHDVVDKFDATGEYLGQIASTAVTPVADEFDGVAVDGKGNVWVYYGNNKVAVRVGKYAAEFTDEMENSLMSEGVHELISESFGSPKPGFALDAEGNFYIKGRFEFPPTNARTRVVKVAPDGKPLNKEVGGSPADWVAVESSSGNVYLGKGQSVARVTSSDKLVERLGVGRLVDAAGIALNETSETVYVVDSGSDDVDMFVLEPPGVPTVEGVSVSSVSSDSAVFSGEINPRGAATSYHFEFGPCVSLSSCSSSGYGSVLPEKDGSAGSAFAVSLVSVQPGGLVPGTAYHFRVVASNSHGVVDGVEHAFVTQASGGPLVLGDGRAWELVTPTIANGGTPLPIEEAGLVQAAVGGGRFTFGVTHPTEVGAPGFGELVQVLSSRATDGGWSSTDIPTSHSAPVGVTVGNGREYRFFSEDLGVGNVESFGPFSRQETGEGLGLASPEATQRTPYLRHTDTCVSEPMTCYTPLVTGASEEADVRPGANFGGKPESPLGNVRFVDASREIGHVILSSSVQLTSTPAPEGGLYEWSENAPVTERLQLVSILPASEGGKAGVNAALGNSSDTAKVGRTMVSDDGSRVFFSAKAPGQQNEHLYMRDTVKEETVRLDVAEGGSPLSSSPAVFQVASSDGSKAFFTDAEPLKAGAGKEYNLYECEIGDTGGGSECVLSDLTPVPAVGEPGAGQSAEVLGGVLGASDGGGYVYFVSNGMRAADGSPGDCGGSSPGDESCGLYVRHNDVTSFIAMLGGGDSPDWSTNLTRMTSRVSDNGLWLAFMSERSLTGYDNRDAVSGVPDEEVYLYSAVSKRLVCASCDPTGARPVGVEYGKVNDQLVGGDRVWSNSQWLAANIPGWTAFTTTSPALHQSRYLSDEGRLFFNSDGSLVPQDSNGNWDVYEYEPTGVGGVDGCTDSVSIFSVGVEGCVGLVSSGLAFGESAFLDASGSGGDVFFLTSGRLVPEDTGTGLKVYDAHVCTSESPCPPSPPPASPVCGSASACRAAPMVQPSIYGAPSSATLEGPGNVLVKESPTVGKKASAKTLTRAEKLTRALKVCKKEPRRKRGGCEKVARKRYGRVKPVKAGSRRRTRG